jgi:hypothetical protein
MMTEQEAMGCSPGKLVEYQGHRATVVISFLRGGASDGFHARFHIKTDGGIDFHDVDYRELTLLSEA